jgi:hypothetical protein
LVKRYITDRERCKRMIPNKLTAKGSYIRRRSSPALLREKNLEILTFYTLKIAVRIDKAVPEVVQKFFHYLRHRDGWMSLRNFAFYSSNH